MAMTTKDYCDSLRQLGIKLASGELESYRLSLIDLAENMSGDDHYKVTRSTSYSRTIINRVPEVKAKGSISIKVVETETDKFFEFTLNTDPKRKVLTNSDIAEIEAKCLRRFARRHLNAMPWLADLEGDVLKGAMIGVQRFVEMITKAAIGDDE